MDNDSPLLCQEKEYLFHRLMTRLIFSYKRARPDIQVVTANIANYYANKKPLVGTISSVENFRKNGANIRITTKPAAKMNCQKEELKQKDQKTDITVVVEPKKRRLNRRNI